MERLKELIEKREEIGKRPAYLKGGSYNDKLEYERLGRLILDEIYQMYKNGKLDGID